jgi:hypothetical protein
LSRRLGERNCFAAPHSRAKKQNEKKEKRKKMKKRKKIKEKNSGARLEKNGV